MKSNALADRPGSPGGSWSQGETENKEGNSPTKTQDYDQGKGKEAEKGKITNVAYKMESHFPPLRYTSVFYTVKRKKKKKAS